MIDKVSYRADPVGAAKNIQFMSTAEIEAILSQLANSLFVTYYLSSFFQHCCCDMKSLMETKYNWRRIYRIMGMTFSITAPLYSSPPDDQSTPRYFSVLSWTLIMSVPQNSHLWLILTKATLLYGGNSFPFVFMTFLGTKYRSWSWWWKWELSWSWLVMLIMIKILPTDSKNTIFK